MCKKIIASYSLMSRILVFVSQDPTEIGLPLSEMLKLIVEAYYFWEVAMGYSLYAAQEALVSFYPMLVRQLYFYRDKVSINEDTDSNKLNFDLGASMIALLTRAVSVAASKEILDTQLKNSCDTNVRIESRPGDVLEAALLTWDELRNASELIKVCCIKWFQQVQRSSVTFSGLRLMGSVCIYVENYFLKLSDQKMCSIEQLHSEVALFYNECFSKFFECDKLTLLLSQLKSHSALGSGLELGAKEEAKNLSSLNTVTFGGKVTPVLLPSSPFPLLLPLVSLLNTLHQMCHLAPPAETRKLVDNTIVLNYLRYISSHDLHLTSQWFTRVEVNFIAHLSILALRVVTCNTVLYHNVALRIMPLLLKGDDALARSLLVRVVCGSKSMEEEGELSQMRNISLDDYEPLKTPTLFLPAHRSSKLVTKFFADQMDIEKILRKEMFDEEFLKKSVIRQKDIPFMINSKTMEHSETLNIFDEYWALMPLKKKMLQKIVEAKMKAQQEVSDGKARRVVVSEISDQSTPEMVSEVLRPLQLLYFCLKCRRDLILNYTNITGWIRHLSLLFVIANDLFLDLDINSYLQGCLRELMLFGGYKLFNDKLVFPGLGNTYDWYKKLIEQFIAVSYADYTFAVCLLIPMAQRQPLAFRSLLWGDCSDALPVIRLNSDEVEKFIPMSEFLEPAELDEDMLVMYKSAMAAGLVSEHRTPMLWKVAVHHVRQESLRQSDKGTGNVAA